MEFEGENSSFRRFDIKRASDFFTGGSGDVCLWIFTGAGDPFVAVSSGDNGTPSGMSSDMRDLREQKRPSWQRARKRRRRGPQKKKEKKESVQMDPTATQKGALTIRCVVLLRNVVLR